jgi:hypothetical protein
MWGELAWKAGEIALASSQVIGERTRRLALAGPTPNVRDQREFALMGQEKSAAVLEVAQAAALPMVTLSQQVAVLAFKQMLTASAAFMSIAASRTATESAKLQSTLMSDTVDHSVAAASQLSASAAKLARAALKPVQTRVRNNVKRLGKR